MYIIYLDSFVIPYRAPSYVSAGLSRVDFRIRVFFTMLTLESWGGSFSLGWVVGGRGKIMTLYLLYINVNVSLWCRFAVRVSCGEDVLLV
jgi:hypothetical protein